MKKRRQKVRAAPPVSDSESEDTGSIGEGESEIETTKNDHAEDGNAQAVSLCQNARTLWLQNATEREDMDTVEDLYRQALNAKREVLAKTVTTTDRKKINGNRNGNSNKRKRNARKTVAALSPEEYRQAGERLSLLYLQSGRPYKATMGLKYLGFECRLSEKILNYPANTNASANGNGNANASSFHSSHNTAHNKKGRHKKKNHKDNHHDSLPPPPCCVIDNFLSPIELHHLRKVFGDVKSSYWTSHNYVIDKEPPAPYFSYVIDLRQPRNSYSNSNSNRSTPKPQRSFLRRIIEKILREGDVSERFPGLRRDARYVELWAHNRPHASGHQLHFDSDDEGRSRQQGFPNHPICSTVLNVSSHPRVGGPTLVTNQRLRNPATTHLQSVRGWLVPSTPSRLVCFDGSVLHGVIPGKGVIPQPGDNKEQETEETETEDAPRPRRVTLMMAFWKDIRVRKGSDPGSARPWPSQAPSSVQELPPWANELNRTDVFSEGSSSPRVPGQSKNKNNTAAKQNQQQQARIIPVHRVYELLDGTPVPKYHEDEMNGGDGYFMPEYDKVFQGF